MGRSAGWWGAVAAAGVAAAGCGSAHKAAPVPPADTACSCPPTPGCTNPVPCPPPSPTVKAPVVMGGFSFYGTDQGLTATPWDASADEGGNAYVAAGDAVFVRKAGDRDFTRVDPAAAGLTTNCWSEADIKNESPSGSAHVCPVISVAGAAPGKAVLGFRGVGLDYDFDAEWARRSGGADVVSFDGTKLTRDRHVFIASPPGMVCEHWANPPTNTVCDASENYIGSTWVSGRKGKGRVVTRIAVNHDKSRSLSYGDVLLGSNHAVISVLVANPDRRGWVDATKGDPEFADTKGVWEHEHPAIVGTDGRFLTGECQAIAFDPRTNIPWFANEIRTASLPDYARVSHPDWRAWWGDMDPLRPFLALWGDAANPGYWDAVTGISFCADGTMWVSSAHGLKRRDLGGSWSDVAMPPSSDQRATAVACDTDGSIWIGFDYGGFARLKDGAWQDGVPQGAPAFTANPVRSIQIDRWSSPRVVYLTHPATKEHGDGGLTVYAGP
jgi:hypothetical protein